jgi:hypothetical protein
LARATYKELSLYHKLPLDLWIICSTRRLALYSVEILAKRKPPDSNEHRAFYSNEIFGLIDSLISLLYFYISLSYI